MDSIIKKEEEIIKLTHILQTSWCKLKRNNIQKKINSLKYEQDLLIKSFLENTNEEYKEKTQLNLNLLANDNILFIVTKESMHPLSNYKTEMLGEIHANGYLYYNAIKTFSLFNLYPFEYPYHFNGVINYLGETNIKVKKTNFKLNGTRMPQKFRGGIDLNGKIEFKTIESYFDFKANSYVSKIIADPFSGDENKREKFISNRADLIKIINEFKAKLNPNP
jgi:hypothetical protein